jgi:hypothetical protein
MKAFCLLLTINFVFTCSLFGQSNFLTSSELPLIENVDSNLILVIENHLEVLKERNIPTQSLIFMQINSHLGRWNQLPIYIIDSLYKENNFPPGFITPGYDIYVTSFIKDSTEFCNIEHEESKFAFIYKDLTIVVISHLKINIESNEMIKVSLCKNLEKSYWPSIEYQTFYYYLSDVNLKEVRNCGNILRE